MAVGQSSSGNTLTTAVTLSSRGLTVAGWFKFVGAGSALRSPFSVGINSSNCISLTLNNSLQPAIYVNSTTSADIGEYVTIINGWYFGGFTVDNSGNATGFISCCNPQNKPGTILYSNSISAGSFTASVSLLADVLGNWQNGSVENVSVWTAALTDSQLKSIMAARSAPPTGLANLWAYWPLLVATDLTDHSGNGRDLTSAGTITTSAGFTVVTTPPRLVNLNLLCVGDSITFGTPSNPIGGPPGPCYPTDLAALLPGSTPVANLGHPGFDTLELIDSMPADVVPLYDATKTNIILFAEGVNDIVTFGATATVTLARYLLYVINAHALGFYIIVGDILPTTTGGTGSQVNMAAFNTALRDNWQGADWFSDNNADPFWTPPSNTAVFGDGLHPTVAGYTHLASIDWFGALFAYLALNSRTLEIA